MLIREILLSERAGQNVASHIPQSKQPFGSSLWLVRKIEDREMNAIKWDGKNALIPKPPGSERYTKHFCLNGVVTDHEMGSFAGNVAILANLNATIAAGNKPAQVRPEDTYFFVDKDGYLTLPNAILVVPKEAMGAPDTDNIIPYTPEEESLEQAVARVLKTKGANYMSIGKDKWSGMDQNAQTDAISSEIGQNFTRDSHTNTVEAGLERALRPMLMALENKWDDLYKGYHNTGLITRHENFKSPTWADLSPFGKILFQYILVINLTKSVSERASELVSNYKDNDKAANYAKYAREQAASLAQKYNIDPGSELNVNNCMVKAVHTVLSPLENLWPQNGLILAKNQKPQKVPDIEDMFSRLYNDALQGNEYQVTPETWTLIHNQDKTWVRAKDQPVMQKLFALKGDTKYYR